MAAGYVLQYSGCRCILYSENNPECAKSSQSRRIFLQDLGKQLVMPAIEDRAKNPKIAAHFTTKSGIECMLGHPVIVVSQPSVSATKTEVGM